jgi:hypothetical protein
MGFKNMRTDEMLQLASYGLFVTLLSKIFREFMNFPLEKPFQLFTLLSNWESDGPLPLVVD